MKKIMFVLTILIAITLTSSVNKQNVQQVRKWEIIRTESITDHFVFTAKDESGVEKIVLAEKDSVKDCRPFKKFIIADSIHQTITLKSGNTIDKLGFYIRTIDGVRIRDSGSLIKIIWNCTCFTDK